MLIEITGDEELKRLLGIEQGFLLSVNHPKNLLTLHRIDCRFCDPETNVGVKPSRKKENNNGEFWFSNISSQILKKAEEFQAKHYIITYCKICNPMKKKDEARNHKLFSF